MAAVTVLVIFMWAIATSLAQTPIKEQWHFDVSNGQGSPVKALQVLETTCGDLVLTLNSFNEVRCINVSVGRSSWARNLTASPYDQVTAFLVSGYTLFVATTNSMTSLDAISGTVKAVNTSAGNYSFTTFPSDTKNIYGANNDGAYIINPNTLKVTRFHTCYGYPSFHLVSANPWRMLVVQGNDPSRKNLTMIDSTYQVISWNANFDFNFGPVLIGKNVYIADSRSQLSVTAFLNADLKKVKSFSNVSTLMYPITRMALCNVRSKELLLVEQGQGSQYGLVLMDPQTGKNVTGLVTPPLTGSYQREYLYYSWVFFMDSSDGFLTRYGMNDGITTKARLNVTQSYRYAEVLGVGGDTLYIALEQFIYTTATKQMGVARSFNATGQVTHLEWSWANSLVGKPGGTIYATSTGVVGRLYHA